LTHPSEERCRHRHGLSARVVTPELLRRELQALESRFDLKLDVLENRLEARLLEKMNEQTKTLYRTIVISNATLAFAMAGIVFGAARLA